MDHELLLARSITQAQHMVRSLGGCGIRSALMRAPVGLTDRGCAYGVRLRPGTLEAGAVLSEIGGDYAPGRLSSYAGGVSGGGAMIYFDAGATTLEKPAAVGRAMARAAAHHEFPGPGELSGLPPGRGDGLSVPAREAAAAAGWCPQPEHVVITGKRHPWPEPGHPVFAGSRGPGGDLRI